MILDAYDDVLDLLVDSVPILQKRGYVTATTRARSCASILVHEPSTASTPVDEQLKGVDAIRPG